MQKAQAGDLNLDPAVSSYQKGIDLIGSQFQNSITPYIQGLTQSQIAQINQLTKLNDLQAPYQQTNYDAMNQFRQFLGMPGLTQDYKVANALSGMAQKLGANGMWSNNPSQNYINSLADKAKLLQNTTDPTQRAAIKQQLTSGLNAWNSAISLNQSDRQLEDYLNRRASQGGPAVINSPNFQSTGQWAQANGVGVNSIFGNKYADWNAYDAQKRQLLDAAKAAGIPDLGSIDYFGGKDILDPQQYQTVKNALGSAQGDIRGILSSLDTYAPNEIPQGLTGDQISQQLQALPNYKFNLDQGYRQLERSQAAKGILNSGRAAVEAQQYGQNYANNVYQQQLGNLASLAGIASPITQQSSAQGPQIAQQLSQPYLQAGQYAGNTMQNQYQLQNQGYMNMGNMQGQGAIAKMQADTQASIANAQMGMQGMQMGLGFLGKLF